MSDMFVKLKTTSVKELNEIFQMQRKASREVPASKLKERLALLESLQSLLLDNEAVISEAINQDYGNRSVHETKLAEVGSLISNISYVKKNLKQWMKPQQRKVSAVYAGGKNVVIPQAKGVVGIITPWNYPLYLAFSPCVEAIAAGNRCIIKMSENSKHLAGLLEQLLPQYFDKTQLHVIANIEPILFPDLPWDHLVFTGSSATGKKIMAAAATYLTPVTLELGGKSPTIIAKDYDIKVAAERVMYSKLFNAGQTCIAPDYVFVPREKIEGFVAAAKEIVAKRYTEVESKDYTSIIDDVSFQRLQATIKNAENKGAKIIPLINGSSYDERRKLVPRLLLDCHDEMDILQREIFGPLLPIIPYDNLDDVIKNINSRERPLALYIYSNKNDIQKTLIDNIISGGVTINDCVFHAAQHDLPFGGIGNSGMGHYHGYDGFKEFSKMRPIFKQGPISPSSLLAPPYGKRFEFIVKWVTKLGL